MKIHIGLFISLISLTTLSMAESPAQLNLSRDILPDMDLYDQFELRGSPPGAVVFERIQPAGRSARTPWTAIAGTPGAAVEEIVVAPSDPNIIYASTYGSGVFKSTDGGHTWSQTGLINRLCSRNGLQVDPTDPEVVYAGTYNWGHFEFGTYRTLNGGDTWEIWGPEGLSYAYTIAVHPEHPDTIYLAGPEGFFYTWDGGNTWNPNDGLPQYLQWFTIHPVNHDTVYALGYGDHFYMVTNGGATYTEVYLPQDYSNLFHLAIDPNNPANLYLGTRYGLLISHDNGQSWNLVDTQFGYDPDDPFSPDPFVHRVTVNTNDSNQLMAFSYFYGLFESLDGGATWNSQQPPVPEVKGYTMVFSPLDQDFIAALWWKGLWRYNGSQWAASSDGLGHQYVSAIQIVDQDEIWMGTGGNGVFKSMDGGSTFEPRNNGLGSWRITGLLVHENLALAGTYFKGLYQSTDGGASWTAILGEDTLAVWDIRNAPNSPEIVYAYGYDMYYSSYQFYRSIDGGQTWSIMYSGTEWLFDYGIDPEDSNHLISCVRYDPWGTGNDYYTVESFDGGANWTWTDPVFFGSRVGDILFLPDTDLVIASTWGNGLLRLTDAGWEPYGIGLPENAYLSDLEWSPTGKLFVATRGAGVYASTDHGATWVPDNDGISNGGVLAFDSKITDAGMVELVATYDGNYQRITSSVPVISVIPGDTLDFGMVYVDYPDTATLVIRNQGLSALHIYEITLTGDGFSLVDGPDDTLVLNYNEEYVQAVAVRPTAEGLYTGVVTITSNSDTNATWPVQLVAAAVLPPVIAVTPDSLAADLFTNDSSQQSLTITNSGGSDLVFEIRVEPMVAGRVGAIAPAPRSNPTARRLTPAQLRNLWDAPVVHPRGETGKDKPYRRAQGEWQSSAIERNTNRSWRLLYTDPDEPELTIDIRNVYGDVTDTEVLFKLDSYAPWSDPVGNTVAIIYIDVDQDTSTGYNLDSEEEIGWELGVDYIILHTGDPTFQGLFQWDPFLEEFAWLDSLTSSMAEPNSDEFSFGVAKDYFAGTNAVNFALLGGSFNEDPDAVPDVGGGYITFPFSPSWLTVSPESGVIPAGGQEDITVAFNATGLFGGDYYALLAVTSNDPGQPLTAIPINLSVTGIPIYSGPDSVNFGISYVGYPDTALLVIDNIGTDDLLITDIVSGDAQVTPAVTELTIPPMSTEILPLTLLATAEGTLITTVSFSTSDQNATSVSVLVRAEVVVAPDIGVDQEDFVWTLVEGAGLTDTLQISNTGGSDLEYTVFIQYQGRSARDAGGPDAFGYTWRDSNEPDGPGFDWIDVSSGIVLYLSDDDYQIGIPLDFPFTFYGQEYNSVNIMSNGWISFTDYGYWFPYSVPDYTEDEYAGVIAPFAGDLYPPDGEVRYLTVGEAPDRVFVVSYDQVPWCCSGPPYMTFQVLLFEQSNRIRFQYLDLQGQTPEAIGISSPDNATGLGNGGDGEMYIAPWIVGNNYALEFDARTEWLAVEPPLGVVAAGGSTELVLQATATELVPGEYSANLMLVSNDPDERLVVIPVTLSVTTLAIDNQPVVPTEFRLHPNHPNPFNPVTTIRFDLPERAQVDLVVYDILGRQVRRLVHDKLEPGFHTVQWDGKNDRGKSVGAGVYLYRIQTEEHTAVRKMVLVK
jgi:photosystem II stability/assembly factor-like uncharacterized protein